LADDELMREPDKTSRLAILLDHLAASLKFYGDVLGLKVFRKHLGWYVENAPFGTSATRREAKATLCRIENATTLEQTVTKFWQDGFLFNAAAAPTHASV
jgi:tRNA-dihydrouridine synthase